MHEEGQIWEEGDQNAYWYQRIWVRYGKYIVVAGAHYWTTKCMDWAAYALEGEPTAEFIDKISKQGGKIDKALGMQLFPAFRKFTWRH